MTHCPHCTSTMLQREYEGDITCLMCSRTVSVAPPLLAYVRPRDLRKTPGPNLLRRVAAEGRAVEDAQRCQMCRHDLPVSAFGSSRHQGQLARNATCINCLRSRMDRKRAAEARKAG